MPYADPKGWRARATRRKISRRYRKRHPAKHRARAALQYAIEKGKVVRGPCELCGSTDRVEGHHDDYAKPLEVRWLCWQHHVAVHDDVARR